MAKAGFVGVGVMGSRMAELLLDKGHTVTIYNRTRDKAQPFLDKGMLWADSPGRSPRHPTSCSLPSAIRKRLQPLPTAPMASLPA